MPMSLVYVCPGCSCLKACSPLYVSGHTWLHIIYSVSLRIFKGCFAQLMRPLFSVLHCRPGTWPA
jgi:hypothetical protein